MSEINSIVLGMNTRLTYSDDELVKAIESSSSWRGVLRNVGLVSTSAGSIRSARARATRLGVDCRHLSERREQSRGMGLERSAAVRGEPSLSSAQIGLAPTVAHLDRAGGMLAAAWFMLCGAEVSWPLEPCRYDLLVNRCGTVRRVQVKTTRAAERGSWKVYLAPTRGHGRRPYSPAEIDDFFVIDADFNYYLIPVAAVEGLQAISLRRSGRFQVESNAHVA